VTHNIKVCWMLGGMNHWENGRKLNDVVYKKTNSGGQVPYSPLRLLGMGKQDCPLSDLYLEHKQAWRIYATLIDEMFRAELLPHRSVACWGLWFEFIAAVVLKEEVGSWTSSACIYQTTRLQHPKTQLSLNYFINQLKCTILFIH